MLDYLLDTGKTDSGRSGYLFATVSSFGAGIATVLGKWILTAISPLLMNSLIFTTATVLLSPLVFRVYGLKGMFRFSRKGWIWLSLFTTSSWLAIWAFWAGVQKIDPSLAAFINRAEVPIAIVLGIVFLKERFTKVEVLGLMLALFGIVIMHLTLRMEYTTGFWLVLLGALFFGITEFVSKIAVRYVEPMVLAYLRNMFMAGMYWIAFSLSGEGFSGLGAVWPGVIALGFAGPILSRMMYLMALRRLELSRVAVISQSQPVFVIIISLLVFSQLPTFREIVGGIFLVSGCLLMIVARYGGRWYNNRNNRKRGI